MTQGTNLERGSKDPEKYCQAFHLNIVGVQLSLALQKIHLTNK